ncbi:10310_t:CDS:2 [Ambispora gerdemannii]|uniref:mRNA cap guanine-N(7) methyltransferase n=1 Tax=Ambispora gerdemannii TaxID=144530 RepID=A0A9N8YPB5_9GLOM|nr:10310_t:CDS:2 [Ambispora gerdemannii]
MSNSNAPKRKYEEEKSEHSSRHSNNTSSTKHKGHHTNSHYSSSSYRSHESTSRVYKEAARGSLNQPSHSSQPRKARKTSITSTPHDNTSLVADHYNNKPDVGIERRNESHILFLRFFNNWVKSVLIGRYAHRGMTVLDMGCGKGGDLHKWNKANIDRLVGIDLAEVSIRHARKRWEDMKGRKLKAEFHAMDCFSYPLSTKIARDEEFDIISMQFCLQYSFESEKKARMALRNVTSNLKQDGFFIGTLPDANWIVKKLKNLKPDQLEFGNSIYSIRFEQKEEFPEFGHKYSFNMEEAISDCPEYLVRFSFFEQLASEYGLELVYKKRFHDLYDEAKEVPAFRDLLYTMKVIKPSEGEMSEEEWEAVEIDSFSGFKIYPGKGKLYVRTDNRVFRFVGSKTESLFLQRKNPRKISWTQVYRRMHKKGITEEVAKKRTRRAVKHQRAIVGASWESIRARRNQKPEVREAARQAALRDAKEKKKADQSKKKAEKAKTASAASRGQPKISKQQARGAQSKVAGKSR